MKVQSVADALDAAVLLGAGPGGRIESHVEVCLGFWDRLRVLFGARVLVHVAVHTAGYPGPVVMSDSLVDVGSTYAFEEGSDTVEKIA
jgi:hypothetical protein